MARRYLPAPYDWASDAANYSAPGEAWDGQPKRLSPAGGPGALSQASGGYAPATVVDPVLANTLEQTRADTLAVANHAALRSWNSSWAGHSVIGTATVVDWLVPTQPNVAGFSLPDIQRWIATFGLTDSTHSGMTITADGGSDAPDTLAFRDQSSALNGLGAIGAIAGVGAGNPGEFVFTRSGGGIWYSNDYGNAWTAWPSGTGQGAVADLFGGLYIWQATSQGLYSASSLGGSPTLRLALTTSTEDGQFAVSADGTTLIFLGNFTSGGYKIYSTTDGTTWTLRRTIGTGPANITWVPGWRQFVCHEFSSGSWRTVISGDGITWTSLYAHSAWTPKTGPQAMTGCGAAIVNAFSANAGPTGAETDQVFHGIAYSFDLGLNWNFWSMTSPLLATGIGRVRAANGRVYASDGYSLYRSGFLEAPESEDSP